MQQNISMVYDLLFLIVFAVVAVCSWHKGFLASLAELIGAVFGVGIAVWASQTAAPQIYEKFLSASVANVNPTATLPRLCRASAFCRNPCSKAC